MKEQIIHILISKLTVLIKIALAHNIYHLPKTFRLYAYSVISTQRSVVYFGGYHNDEGPTDVVAEYKNLNWKRLGSLAGGRYSHRTIQMGTKIYIFGGFDTT